MNLFLDNLTIFHDHMMYKHKRFDLSIFECLNTPEQLKPLCHNIGNTKIIMILHPSLEAQRPLIATLFASMSINVQEIKNPKYKYNSNLFGSMYLLFCHHYC